MTSIPPPAVIIRVLSAGRFQTYEKACVIPDDAFEAALRLYAWNAEASAALLTPLHLCEISIRNAVADAVQALYGDQWPWSKGFEQSLPDPAGSYSPRKDLSASRRAARSTGQVIAELKFVFWQKMFTQRYDNRLWRPHLRAILPNLPADESISVSRQKIVEDLEQIRRLRNRIAHHEPIFSRNLDNDLAVIMRTVHKRCGITAAWLAEIHRVDNVICRRPG